MANLIWDAVNNVWKGTFTMAMMEQEGLHYTLSI